MLKSSNSSLKLIWMDSVEAAEYLRISVKTLLNLTSTGKIVYYKFGARNRFLKDDLDQLLLQNKRGNYGN